MSPEPRALAAGTALLLGWLLASLARVPAAASPCPEPREISARGGHTAAVRCGSGAPLRALRGPARLLFGQKLDLNREDARAFEALPGIGAARAQAIVRERARRPFRSLEDLERVPGIGPVTRRALASRAAVGTPP